MGNEVPQTGRRPLPISDDEKRVLLRRRRKEDRIDIFASDPDKDISELGRLALRRDDINDLFVLGDLCAQKSISQDGRLLVFYVGKTLIAYRRAMQAAQNDVDRKLANRALGRYVHWVIECVEKNPTPRNAAIALYAISDVHDDKLEQPPHHDTVLRVLQLYANQYDATRQIDAIAGKGDDDDDFERTQAYPGASEIMLSESSRTQVARDLSTGYLSAEVVEGQSETQHEDGFESDFSSIEVESQVLQSPEAPQSARRPPPQEEREDEFNIGDRIEGRYEVVDIRWGGMGVVYLCYDHELREPVAIKSFQARLLDNERAVSRFINEALTWIQLEKHPHIVQARLVQNFNNRPHIILEHVSGPEGMGADLRSWIDRKRVNLPRAVLFAIHIALAMRHAVDKVPGLVHRDLKPGNILVTHEGIAKVSDFGLANSLDIAAVPEQDAEIEETSSDEQADRLTRAGALVGTPAYMSPEQCKAEDVSPRSDIYSFGAVLYEMLTGHRVFKAHKFQQWIHAHLKEQPRFSAEEESRIPQRLRELVLLCLAKQPHERPHSWGQIIEELATIYTDIAGEMPALEISGPELRARDWMDKGYSLTELGRYDEALQAYEQAIALQPDYAWAWARKGRTLRLMGRYKEAFDCYEYALAIHPNYAWAWNGKGIILDRMGKHEEALSCFIRATELSPDDVWYWYNRADVLQKLGRYDEAI
ncbi:MAG: tetratricopeptide repeat protein, partial [Chloroflexi bacterium]